MKEQIYNLYDKVNNGETSPLDAFIELRELKQHIEDVILSITDSAMVEAERYNGEQYKGYEIKVGTVGGRYTYDHIPQIVTLKNELKDLEKLHQTAYKLNESGSHMIDENGEEVIPAHYKANTTSIQLKKI